MIWKTIQWIIHLLFWIGILLVLAGMVKNRRSANILTHGQIEFAPRWFGVWALMFVALQMSFTVPRYLKHGLGKPGDFITGVSLGVAVLGFLCVIPGTLIVTSDGLEQIYWFWRNKKIRWDEIVEINTGEKGKSSTVTVMGADGTKIVHSGQLPDRPRFLLELKQHCGENLPPDFPREPVASM
jgi:hypothetical protein